MDPTGLRIGDVAARAGVSVRSLRYYEEQGLLRSELSGSGQRIYDEDAVERVRLVQQLYAAGLSSGNIVELLPRIDSPSERSTARSMAVMRREHARLSAQIDELSGAREHLGRILADASEHLRQVEPGA